MIEDPDPPSPLRPPSAFDALAFPAFRLLLAGSVGSGLAQQMQWVISGYLVYELSDSAVLLGLTGLFRAAPVFLFSLVGGALADAVDRRKVMLVCQSLATLVCAGLMVVAWAGALEVWHLYLAVFLTAVASALFNPTRMAVVPLLVPEHALTNAVTFNTVAQQTSQLVGPALAGVALAALGGDGAYAMCSLAFAISVAATVGLPGDTVRSASAGRSTSDHLTGGLRFVRTEPVLLGLLITDWTVNILTSGYRTLLPVFAKDVLQVGPEGLGLLSGAPGLGAILGSVSVIALANVRSKGLMVMVTLVLYCLALIVFSGSYWFPLSVAALALVGYFDSFAMVLRNTVMLLVTPDELRGRTQSVVQIVGATGPALAGTLAGGTAAAIGAGPALILGSILSIGIVALARAFAPEVWRFKSASRQEERQKAAR